MKRSNLLISAALLACTLGLASVSEARGRHDGRHDSRHGYSRAQSHNHGHRQHARVYVPVRYVAVTPRACAPRVHVGLPGHVSVVIRKPGFTLAFGR